MAARFGYTLMTEQSGPRELVESIPCGPDLDKIAEAVKEYVDAGFTDVALVQIGDENQDRFLSEAAEPLLEVLRSL